MIWDIILIPNQKLSERLKKYLKKMKKEQKKHQKKEKDSKEKIGKKESDEEAKPKKGKKEYKMQDTKLVIPKHMKVYLLNENGIKHLILPSNYSILKNEK